jgi:hypothetical protein
MVVIVIETYASSLSHGTWPPSHPWSGIALSAIAVQFFLPLKRKPVFSFVASLVGLAAAVLWIIAGRAAQQAHAGSSEAKEPPKPQGTAQLGDDAGSPVGDSVQDAAARALTEAARLASSCRPKGGPVGSGKVRVIYEQDGTVQSVEVLSQEFRDNLTGSCVRMVFRRATIPAFSGPSPTFIKSFSIPEE